MTEGCDTLISGALVVTMNERREVVQDGAVAIVGDRIVDVGKAADLKERYAAADVVGGQRFVVTPGLVNTHIHITGEPPHPWLRARQHAVRGERCSSGCARSTRCTRPEEERLSAQLATAEMFAHRHDDLP